MQIRKSLSFGRFSRESLLPHSGDLLDLVPKPIPGTPRLLICQIPAFLLGRATTKAYHCIPFGPFEPSAYRVEGRSNATTSFGISMSRPGPGA